MVTSHSASTFSGALGLAEGSDNASLAIRGGLLSIVFPPIFNMNSRSVSDSG